MRKNDWIRLNKLDYEEIDIESAANDLVEQELLDVDVPLLEEALDMLTLNELKLILFEFDIEFTKTTKKYLKDRILSSSQQKKIRIENGSVGCSIDHRILQRVNDVVGYIGNLRNSVIDYFQLLKTLYFLENVKDRSSFATAILTQIERRKYPKYSISTKLVFTNRSELDDYMFYLTYEQSLVETGNHSIPLDSLKEMWKIEVERKPKESYFLARYTAGWIMTRILTQEAVEMEKRSCYADANSLYTELLSQTKFRLGKRGFWWLRILINMKHLKKSKQEIETVARQALEDEHLRTGNLFDIKSRLGMVECKFKTRVIEGKLLTSEAGKKSVFEFEIGNEKMNVSVEEYAGKHYESLGYRQIHCEGSILSAIFGILFFGILFKPRIEEVFQTEYQTAPLDLETDSFYAVRKHEIEERLLELKNVNISEEFEKVYQEHYGVFIIGVNWDLMELEEFKLICRLLQPKIAVLLRVFAEDYKHARSGIPDLFVWNKESYIFSEVKGPRDSLSNSQKFWMNLFQVHEIPSEILRVKEL